MKIVTTIAEVRADLAAHRAAARTVAFVPTMGALHEGHLSLIQQAHAASNVVIVSVFVNPIQFNDQKDLAAYPRDLAADAALAESAGADLLFAPDAGEMYPEGFQTAVTVRDVTRPLEGAARGTSHFDGVTTVVAKLFNIIQPTIAYFGQKDAQQVVVVRQMVRDLAFPVQIRVGATVRELDGLALSSRNVRLDAESRTRALALKGALDVARERIDAGVRDAGTVVRAAQERLAQPGVVPEYFAIVSPVTLTPVERIEDEVLVAVAARVGDVRLIDNILVSVGRHGP